MRFREFIENRVELANAFKDKLHGVPQDPTHHPEGDVLAHTRLVRKAIPKAVEELKNAQSGPLASILSDIDFTLSPEEFEIVSLAAWIHDIGKNTATTIGGNPWRLGGSGKIQAIGHQDKSHFIPQLKDLEDIAPEETKQLYLKNENLINWLVEHHMDFASGQGFSKSFVAQNFDGAKVKNTLPMKLLLILMWSDKMGRLPEDTILQAVQKNSDNLVRSSERAAKRAANISKQSVSFRGGPETFAAMLKQRNLTPDQRAKALKGKFPTLSQDQILSLSESTNMQPTVIKANIPMPSDVLVIDEALRQDDPNTVVYAVGGAVRDYLFHQFHGKDGDQFRPKDTDLTTNLSEEEILERLRSPYAQQLGISVSEKDSVDTFGVVFAHVRHGETLEIAPFRKDVGSNDGRRPDRVEQAEIHEDAMRRDLTINNLYYDFHKKEILDFNENGQGIQDVKDGIARPVGDPLERFNEDKLRVLRLVRFFSRFNNGRAIDKLDKETLAAIEHFRDLRNFGITSERIYMEFMAGIKQSLNTAAYLQNYVDLGLMPTVFPGMNVDTNDIGRLGVTKNPKVILAWLLRHNSNVDKTLNALKYPKEISEPVEFLIDSLKFGPDNAFSMIKRRDKNADISAYLKQDLAEFAKVVGDPSLVTRINHFANYDMPVASGQELMAQGLKGKQIGDEQKRRGTEHYQKSFDDFMKQKENLTGVNQ